MKAQRRIFVVGHNKTGTRSIHQFLSRNGFRGVHWDNGRLAESMARNLVRGRPLLQGYDRYEVFSDMESVAWGTYGPRPAGVVRPGRLIYAYRWFKLLDRQEPGSLFIYNTRPLADWLESRLAHEEGLYAEACRAALACWSRDARFSLDDLRAHWSDEFHEHARLLREHFADSPRLLEIDIAAPDAGERLAAFLERHGHVIASRSMPHLGARAAGSVAPKAATVPPATPKSAIARDRSNSADGRLLVTVIGRGHSGTRAMSHTLSASGVFMGDRLNASGDLVPAQAMYDAARIMARHVRWLGGVEWDFSALQDLPIPDEFVSAVREYLAGTLASPARLRGWKLPETTLCFPWIRRMFPDARYIHWVRDPRDCILGGHLTDDLARWGVACPPTNDVRLRRAYSWIYQYKLVQSVPKPEHWIEIRFEDFVLDQERTLGRIEAFLGIPLARIPVRPDRVGRHAIAAGGSSCDVLEPVLRECGYAVPAGSEAS